jgi:hypothetical protein
MFCPRCRVEYSDGVSLCADCRVPLVAALPPEVRPEPAEFVEILRTLNIGDIAIIKAILDDTAIAYVFLGEQFNYVDPLIQPARLMVRSDQAEEARELLRDLELTYAGVSQSHDEANEEG